VKRNVHNLPVLGFAAYSGTGKTTLLRKLIPMLTQQGLRIGVIKHAHHNFDVDHPGKDSYELRKAGAERMLVGSRRRWALVVETEDSEEPCLQDLLARMPGENLDLILVEGFKHENFPKIELHRGNGSRDWLYPNDESIIAVATDDPEGFPPGGIRVLDIGRLTEISGFVLDWLASERSQRWRQAGN